MTRTLFRNLAVPVVILVLWQLLSQSGFIKPVILPSPLAILERLWTYLLPAQTFAESAGFSDWIWSSELLSDLVASMRRVILGFAVGAGLALPLGLLMGTDRRFEAYLNPVVQFLRPIRRSPIFRWRSYGSGSAIRRRSSLSPLGPSSPC